jgi:hypothetical protein
MIMMRPRATRVSRPPVAGPRAQSSRYLADAAATDVDEPAGQGSGGDLAPEGLLFGPAKDSPTGEPLLVVSYEVSGTTTVFTVG